MKCFYTNLDIFNFLEKHASSEDNDTIDIIDPGNDTYDTDDGRMGGRVFSLSPFNYMSDAIGSWFTTDTKNRWFNDSIEALNKVLDENLVIKNKSKGES